MKGESVEGAFESLRLFGICQATKFTAWPVAGGLYDQHPQLIDEWSIILHEQAEHQRQEHEKSRQEAERAKARNKRGR